jgi:hypothetical protein
VGLTHSFGYGTYLFSVQDIGHFEPAVALSLLTWDDLGADQNHREVDVELSQWGDPKNKNAEYVVQPYYVPSNVVQFTAPPGLLTYSLYWQPGKVSFETVRGHATSHDSRTVAKYEFTAGVPTPGGESVRMNFCNYAFSLVPLKNEAEVVIEKFQYLP